MDIYEIPNHTVVHQPSSMDLPSDNKGFGDPPMNGHIPVEFSRAMEYKSEYKGLEDVKDCITNGLLNVLGFFVAIFQAIGSCFCVFFCQYGEPASTEPGSEILPTWRMLWVEFVNRTTWHGLKYLELRSRYLARKMIWTAVMLSNITLFMYIMTTKLQNLLTYPVSVSVTVSYGEKPPFSAATICNHNPYRMTAMHENGLYDIMVNDLDPSCTFCVDFQFYPGICDVKYGGTSFHLKVSDVTRKVCMFMCANAYDSKCSGFMYDRRTKSCNLTSYTGEWIDPNDPYCEPSKGFEFYRRIRRTPQTEIICTFEDSLCPLNPSKNENDAFVLLEARLDGVLKDNTLNLGSGHVMSLRTTELKSGYTAQMTLPFLNTTDSCMELFYWLKLEDPDSGDLPSISVSVLTEELERITLTSTNRYIKDWNRLFTRLPDGLHQIIIEGTRSLNQSSGISIDDLTIEKCQNFEKSRSCKRTRLGTAYLGTTDVSAKGEKCIPWDQLKSPLIYRLPDDNPRDAKNYCRNIPQENWSEPSCMVSSDENYYVSACQVSYCECFNDTYFKCDNGLCLPPSLLCNGIKDCLDGSDEAEICRNRQNVECVFNDDYVCGYTMESVGQLTWTRVPSSELTSYTDVTIYRNVIALCNS